MAVCPRGAAYEPASSGPRCAFASVIVSRTRAETSSRGATPIWTTPQIPHIASGA
jgi:hypothetical protein